MSNILEFYGMVLLVWALVIGHAPHKYNDERERVNKVTFELVVGMIGVALLTYVYRENIMVLCAYIIMEVVMFFLIILLRFIMKGSCDY